MATTISSAPVERTFKTVATSRTRVHFPVGNSSESHANATVMSEEVNGVFEGPIFVGFGTQKLRISALEASALAYALIEHLHERRVHDHGEEVGSIDGTVKRILEGKLPEVNSY